MHVIDRGADAGVQLRARDGVGDAESIGDGVHGRGLSRAMRAHYSTGRVAAPLTTLPKSRPPRTERAKFRSGSVIAHSVF